MNKMKRLTALLLALMMILSTFAAAEPAYQLGEMTSDDWQAVVDNAEKELFKSDEGDSGKEIMPELPEQPEQGDYYPYTDGTTTALIVNGVDVKRQMTASGVAVLLNSDAGQWQMQIDGTWINITNATGDALWVTAAMMNGLINANFRKGVGDRNMVTGEYTSYTNVVTVEIVAEVAGKLLLIDRADDETTESTPIPTPPSASEDVMTLAEANEELKRSVVTINYLFESNNAVAAQSTYYQVGEHNPQLVRTSINPDITGYKPVALDADDLPDGFTHTVEQDSETEKYIGTLSINATITEDVVINIYYEPDEVTYTVKYYQEKISYPANATTDDKYTEITDDQVNQKGLTDSTIAQDITADGKQAQNAETKEQYYAPTNKYPGFLPLLYDDGVKIAADGSTEVPVRYQRLYYLISFKLGGGYGVDPVYDKFGAKIEDVGEPQRAGYTFKGWATTQELADAGTVDVDKLPTEVPAENQIYYAVWEAQPVAYTVVYWRENANDTNYSFWGSQKFDEDSEKVLAGSTLNYNESIHAVPTSISQVVINGVTVDESNYFTYNPMLTDKDVVVAGDGTAILNVYYYRNTYTVYFDADGAKAGLCAITPHTHGDGTCTQELICHVHDKDCVRTLICQLEEGHVHSAENCGTTLVCTETVHTTHTRACYEGTEQTPTNDPDGNQPSNPQEGQVYVYEYWNWGQRYTRYVYVNGQWYQLSGSSAQNGDILSPSCHKHSAACYTFNCNEVEHTHVESCYTYTCPAADHVHTDACYRPCTKPVHGHSTACTNANSTSNVIHVITAKYNADINWPRYDEIAYWTLNSAHDGNGINQSSKVLTLTHDFCNKDDSRTLTVYAETASTTYALNYMFESFDQDTSVDETVDKYFRKEYDGLKYDRSPKYSEIAVYSSYNSWGYKVIDGFTRAQSNSAAVTDNPYKDELDADKIAYLYYKRNRWTLSFYNHSSDIDPQLWDSNVMFDQALDGYVIDGKNINGYKPATGYYPSDLEAGAYYFDGWYTTPECFEGTEFAPETSYMPNGDVNVYGKWTPYKYTVTVYNNPEDAAASANVLYHFKSIEHGKPTSSAYTYDNPDHFDQTTGAFKEPQPPDNGLWEFVGWFYINDEGKETGFSFTDTRITHDTVAYAKWRANAVVKYKVYYVVQPPESLDKTDAAAYKAYYEDTSNWVADFYEGSGLAGNTVTEPAKGGDELYDKETSPTGISYQEGYYPVRESHNVYIDLVEANNVYVFEYVPKGKMPYTVQYLTEVNPGNDLGTVTIDGKLYYRVAEDKVEPDNMKAIVTENYVPVGDNYMPTEFQERLVIEANDTENIIRFFYVKDLTRTTLEINHYTKDYGSDEYELYNDSAEIVSVSPNAYNAVVDVLSIDNYPFVKATRSDGGDTAYEVTVNENRQITFTLEEGAQGVVLNLYYDETPVTINYKVATACDGMGTVTVGNGTPGNSVSETIGVVTGSAEGGTAISAENYKFVGWYSDNDCAEEDFVSTENPYVPGKVNGLNVAATYYAKFELDVADLTITKQVIDSDLGAEAPKDETFIVQVNLSKDGSYTYTVNGVESSDKLIVTNGVGNTMPIKAGDTIVIENIVIGTTFTVTETDYPAYFKASAAVSGTMDADGETAAITNKYQTGHLTITKTVTGVDADDIPKDTVYTFTVKNSDGGVVDTISLTHGQSATISNLPIGDYTVTEGTPANIADYTFVKVQANGADSDSASVKVIDNDTVTVPYTNVYKKNTASLTVEKTVVASTAGTTAPADDEFRIKITFTAKANSAYGLPTTYKLNNGEPLTLTNGAVELPVKAGDKITFPEVVIDTQYTVEEISKDGYYEVSYANAAGTIAADATATVTNTYKTGSLTISKTVEGDTAPDDTFTFELALSSKHATYSYSKTAADGATTNDTVAYNGTVELKAGESVTIMGIPAGTDYTVNENPDNDYITTPAHATGEIEKDSTVEAAFTNTYQRGDLTITKTVVNNTGVDRSGDAFEFTITLNDTSINGTYGPVTFTNGIGKTTLKAGESVTIKDLPKNVGYTVTEADVLGYADESTGATGTIEAGKVSTAAFTNTYEVVKLEITKKVVGNTAPADDTFNFTVTLTDTITNAKLTGSVKYSIDGGEAQTANLENGAFRLTLKKGQTATIAKLPKGVTYAVAEAPDTNYTTEYDGMQNGTITKDSVSTTVTNTYQYCDLVISKRIDPPSEDHRDAVFTFNLVLPGTQKQFDYEITDHEKNVKSTGKIGNGGSFKLEENWFITLKDVPVGTTYEVTETLVSGYATYVSVNSEIDKDKANINIAQSTVALDKANTVKFINVYGLGSLLVVKNVVGPAPDDVFGFTMNVTDAEGKIMTGIFPLLIQYDQAGEPEYQIAVDISQPITFDLKKGWSALIAGLPKGAKFTITESTHGAYETWVKDEVVSTSADDPDYGDKTDTIKGTVPETGMHQVVYTNVYQYSTLTINKVGMEDGESAIFQVEAESRYNPGKTTIFTVSVPNKGSVTIRDLRIGSNYTITEIGSWSNRYAVAKSVTGKIDENGSVVTITNTDKNNQWLHDEDYVHNDFSKPGDYPKN